MERGEPESPRSPGWLESLELELLGRNVHLEKANLPFQELPVPNEDVRIQASQVNLVSVSSSSSFSVPQKQRTASPPM